MCDKPEKTFDKIMDMVLYEPPTASFSYDVSFGIKMAAVLKSIGTCPEEVRNQVLENIRNKFQKLTLNPNFDFFMHNNNNTQGIYTKLFPTVPSPSGITIDNAGILVSYKPTNNYQSTITYINYFDTGLKPAGKKNINALIAEHINTQISAYSDHKVYLCVGPGDKPNILIPPFILHDVTENHSKYVIIFIDRFSDSNKSDQSFIKESLPEYINSDVFKKNYGIGTNIKVFRYVCSLIIDERSKPDDDNPLIHFFKTIRPIDFCYWGIDACGVITYDEERYEAAKKKVESSGLNVTLHETQKGRQLNLLFITQKVADTVFIGCDGVIYKDVYKESGIVSKEPNSQYPTLNFIIYKTFTYEYLNKIKPFKPNAPSTQAPIADAESDSVVSSLEGGGGVGLQFGGAETLRIRNSQQYKQNKHMYKKLFS